MDAASAAIWNVLLFAMAIGCPLKFPNHVRVAALEVRSMETIDHAEPDVFVHDSAVGCGNVTFDPADDAVDAPGTACPPVT